MGTGKININDATVQQLTQLPGVAKNMAYRIVNYRERRGLFFHWMELEQVPGFPVNRMHEIRNRAVLEEVPKYAGTPRASKTRRLYRTDRKSAGHKRATHSTRMTYRLKGLRAEELRRQTTLPTRRKIW
jgi:competence ComEA-like helix-hairpin-helix protein